MRGTLYIYGAVLIALCATISSMVILGANGKEEKRRGSDWCSDEDVLFHDLEEGKLLASSEGKPLMAIITAEWCSPCRTLKYALKEFQPFQRLAKKFVMVLLEGDEEPRAEEYSPDGAYFPAFFLLARMVGPGMISTTRMEMPPTATFTLRKIILCKAWKQH